MPGEHEKHYKQVEAQGKVKSGKPVQRYCWVKMTFVRFLDGKCMLEGCLDRLSKGCLQVMHSV